MATPTSENLPASSLELRFKRWTAVAVVCFLGLLAALPFRSAPHAPSPTVASSHRERSLRFRAEAERPAEPVRQIAEPPASRPQSSIPHSITPPTATLRPQVRLPKPLPVAEAAPIAAPDAEPEETTTEPEEPLATDLLWRSKADAPRAASAGSAKTGSNICLAQRGENLMDISERALGDRARWKELMPLNPRHRSSFDELSEGEEISLPAKP